MRNYYRTNIQDVIARAASESGIRADESYKASLVSIENGICEMNLTTEWNMVTCYADMNTGEILGIMGEALAA